MTLGIVEGTELISTKQNDSFGRAALTHRRAHHQRTSHSDFSQVGKCDSDIRIPEWSLWVHQD